MEGGAVVSIRIELIGDSIQLTAPPYRKEMVKQIPGARHNSKLQCWTLPLSWAVCVIARGVFGAELEVGPELVAWATKESERIKTVLAAREEALRV
jgi:hypothetical protein